MKYTQKEPQTSLSVILELRRKLTSLLKEKGDKHPIFLKSTNLLHETQMSILQDLNFDPVEYWRLMNACTPHSRPIGMKTLLERVKDEFSLIQFGYFNPPKEKFYAMDRNKSRF